MKQFKKTKLAAIVGTAALATGLSAPANAVVVVGGDNGWEISFDGNVNAFLTFGSYDSDDPLHTALGGAAGQDYNNARITSGFLPAFFSFNAKSPTVNGLTGTARISFAPTINNGGSKTQFSAQSNNLGPISGINGATIDTREVVANIDGSFGQISFGRTLSLFGRQAILGDMTLFGVGFQPGNHYGSVTFGRVGHGYTYPDFSSRIQWTSPSMNGFQVAVGAYDPSTISSPFIGTQLSLGVANETDIPRFEGELTYNTTFQGGSIKVWGDGLWQEINSTASGFSDLTIYGIGGGASIGFGGFNVTGYVYDGEGLGLTAQFNTLSASFNTATGDIEESESDGFYVQGTYTFNGRTKVGYSYGESTVDAGGSTNVLGAGFGALTDAEFNLAMHTVGVYHDVTPWLKVIAEYNHQDHELNVPGGGTDGQNDTFSIGSFILW